MANVSRSIDHSLFATSMLPRTVLAQERHRRQACVDTAGRIRLGRIAEHAIDHPPHLVGGGRDAARTAGAAYVIIAGGHELGGERIEQPLEIGLRAPLAHVSLQMSPRRSR